MSLLLAAALSSSPLLAGTTDGSCLEAWTLLNFQPKSTSFKQEVPSSAYRDPTTVIVLLASW